MDDFNSLTDPGRGTETGVPKAGQQSKFTS